MTRYYIEYQAHEGDWLCDHYGAVTPVTIDQAADLLAMVKEENTFCVNFRVTLVRAMEALDVTDLVERHIEESEATAAKEAAEDEAHERQDRHSWGEV